MQKEIQYWLERQPVYQIYQPKPKQINYAHYTISKPNHTHQVDILYLPHDGKYKYALTVIDCASRFKAACPMKVKTANETAKAIEHIYESTKLNYPQVIMSDFGGEFTGPYLKLMKEHDVKVSKSKNKKHVAFVERFNRTLAEKLFKPQYVEELISNKQNTEWVANLQPIIDELNNSETRMIGMKPIDAIELDDVEQPSYKEVPDMIDFDSIVRYLYKPGEAEDDTKYRATDPIWSTKVYLIDEITDIEGQPHIYTLQGIEDRTFTREELMIIPPDTVGLEKFIITE
jgi:transposase InsO family protein